MRGHNTEELSEEFRSELTAAIEGGVRFDPVSRAMHATDASVYQILPGAVVTPLNEEDVRRSLEICRRHGVSITARGGGTSQAGQAIGSGVSLDFSRHMNRLLELDPARRTVVVEPGMVLDELNAVLKGYGLQLPLDLSTSSRATIGGMIANNSAGTRSVIYGKTIDYVEQLELLLADGTRLDVASLDEAGLQAKCGQADREGELYRTVREMGEHHAGEIEKRFPKILRRVGGYNLDEFTPGRIEAMGSFNLARLLVGSEGTLGLTLRARLSVVPLPEKRVVCVVQFDELLEAMRATPIILEHGPSAVELVDRTILDTTRGRVEFEPLRDFIVGDPGAVLLVELMGEDASALSGRLDGLELDLGQRGLGHHFHRALEPAAQARIWTLRKAALGLTMSVKGTDAKGISFVEDTAVAPEHLHDYIENFQRILQKYETRAGFYAHASVGLLHIRPAIDMKREEGIERFAAIAEEVSDLVLEYGGALSGEHGDGLVRAPFQEKMFGPGIYSAFQEVKNLFDPDGMLNPGKIVNAPPLLADLRYGPDYVTPEVDTYFDFSDFGGVLRAAEQCSGVGACRKTLTGTMCPSYMATRNERDSTRGRANALRQALAGQIDLTGLSDPALGPVMELCLECKACKSECPTGVDMARLKGEYLYQSREQRGWHLRDRLNVRILDAFDRGARLAPLVNRLSSTPFFRHAGERLLGLDRRRVIPRFSPRSFVDMWDSERDEGSGREEVVLFVDTFNNFFEPNHLEAAARLVRKQGIRVTRSPRVCCGRPLISKGYLPEAAQQAKRLGEALSHVGDGESPILFLEPSCYSAVVDDHINLLRGEARTKVEAVAERSVLIESWFAKRPQDAPIANGSAASSGRRRRVLVHGHCHQKALIGNDSLLSMLGRRRGWDLVELDSGCCGMAGLFGYEQYDVSQKIAERRLLPAVREMEGGDIVVAPGFSCREQIRHFTGVEAVTPAAFLVGS